MSETPGHPTGSGGDHRVGTFSYLPELDDDGLRAQIEHLIDEDLIAAIEHVEPGRASQTYWYLWKLPLFGVKDADLILQELEACRSANPGHHVRLIGYDNRRQTQGVSLIAFQGR